MDELDDEYYDIDFFSVNLDANVEEANQFGVRSIPTLLFLKDGEVVDTLIGNQQKVKIQGVITKSLILE